MEKSKFETLDHKFHVTQHKREDAVFSIPAITLLDPKNMSLLIDTYTPMIKAVESDAAAAYFAGWFTYVAMAKQYVLSNFNQSLDLTLSNLTVQIVPNGTHFQYVFVVNEWSMIEAPSDEYERASWRQQELAAFHGQTVQPIFEAVTTIVDYPLGQLWGQLPTKFNYFMNDWKGSMTQETACKRIDEDYAGLKALEPSIFGLKKNPFDVKIRMIEDALDCTKQVRMKNVCCLYYKTEASRYCYTCPRMKEEGRVEFRTKYRAEKAATASH
ncbi:hypothetical protein D3C73_870600 [compost metagenome]